MKVVFISGFFILFAFFFQCGEGRGIYKLSSGKEIKVYDVSKINGWFDNERMLSINYQTNLSNSNPELLQREAEQVWNELFKQEAEKFEAEWGTVRAYPFDGQQIHMKKATEFVLRKNRDGEWNVKKVLTQDSISAWNIKNP